MGARIAVVFFPPEEVLEAVEGFRALHDPLARRIDAHVAVAYPAGWLDERRALERLRGSLSRARRRPFTLCFDGTGHTTDGLVYLRVGEGARDLRILHHLLTDALGPPPGTVLPRYFPHLTVGRSPGEAEAEFLERQLRSRLPAGPLEVGALALVREDAKGRWQDRHRLALPAAGERAGVA